MYYKEDSEERKKQNERYKNEGIIDFSGKGDSWKWIGGKYIDVPDDTTSTDDTSTSSSKTDDWKKILDAITNSTQTSSDNTTSDTKKNKTISWDDMFNDIIKKGEQASEQMIPPVEKKLPPVMGEQSTYGFINYNRLEGSRYGRLGA